MHSDGDELEEEDDDVLADFAFERGTGIVGVDHLARVASAEKGSPDAKAAAGPSSSFGDDPGVAATMAVARMMSATGAKSLPQGLVRLMSPYQAHYDELKPADDRCLTQLGGCAVVGPGGAPIYSWVDRGLCDVPDFEALLEAIDAPPEVSV